MLDFGTSNDNSNGYNFGDLVALEFAGDFTIAFFSYMDSIAGTWQRFFGKITSGSNTGWECRSGTSHSDKMGMVIGDSSDYEDFNATTAINADTTVRSYMMAFDQAPTATVHHYVAGSSDGSPTGTNTLAAATGAIVDLNDRGTAGLGASGARGHIMAWNSLLASGDATIFNTGTYVPVMQNLVFWIRGLIDPAYDRVSKTNGTKVNTVALEALPLTDNLFKDGQSYRSILVELFIPFLVASKHMLGSDLLFNGIVEHTDKRCFLDWMPSEMKELTDAFRRRPAWSL